jgi:transcriptional regulator with XRE-family HTH domain
MRSEDVAVRFGANLVRLRRRARMSQEELAFRASLHRTQIGNLEHGKRLAGIDTLLKLCSALEVDSCELLDGIFWVAAAPRSENGAFRIENRFIQREVVDTRASGQGESPGFAREGRR